MLLDPRNLVGNIALQNAGRLGQIDAVLLIQIDDRVPVLHSLRGIRAKYILGALFCFAQDFDNFQAVEIVYGRAGQERGYRLMLRHVLDGQVDSVSNRVDIFYPITGTVATIKYPIFNNGYKQLIRILKLFCTAD